MKLDLFDILKKNKQILTFAFCTGVLGVVISVSLLKYNHSYLMPWVVGTICSIFILLGISFIATNSLTRLIRKIILTICLSYLLIEILTYLFIGFGFIRPDIGFFYKGIMATDRKFAKFDSISGFRGIPGQFRYLAIEDGLLEMDHSIQVNRQGWFSKFNFQFEKRGPNKKRYIVLGDSYSASLATGIPWPDMFQELCSKNGINDIELYNFSLDGSGLVNWHRLFFKHIIPFYEFDGVIIASSSEKSAHPDLDRHFFVMHSFENNTAIQMINVLKEPFPVSFPIEKGVPIITIYPAKELDNIKEKYLKQSTEAKFTLKSPDLWFLFALYGISDGLINMNHLTKNASAYNKPFEAYYSKADQTYRMEYFEERYKYNKLMKEIIEYCNSHKKKVLLVSIPDIENAKEFAKGNKVMCVNELEFLSKYYHIDYLNGFAIFQGKSDTFIEKRYYTYDRHWNPEGAKLFSEYLFESKILK